jgi:hypothetical protein
MQCPFCGDYRSPIAFAFVNLFTPQDRRLQAFCVECAAVLKRAAERKAVHTHLTFDECLHRYVQAVRVAFDDAVVDAERVAQ